MTANSHRYTNVSTRLMTAAALVASLGLFCSGQVFAGEHHEERAEVRIKDMHDKLKITAEQEEQWAKVDQAMLEDAKIMDKLTQSRADHAKDMTAIDDLKSYAEITDAHAAGIKRLTPLFTTLYESMSEAQKKEADTLFRHGDHKHGGHKPGHKTPEDK
jgi:hypothetical protein